MRVTVRAVAVVGLLLSLAVACSDGRDDTSGRFDGDSTRTTARRDVPVPQITVLPGARPIDPAEWKERWRTTPGNTTGECVRVRARREYRSGDFIVGNFQSFIEQTARLEDAGSQLYFIPLFPADSGPPLTVSAERHGGSPLPALHFEFPANSRTTSGWPFYVTGTELPPEPATWRILASAGRNYGCFDVSVPC